MDIWTVKIKSKGTGHWTFCGEATSAEIACRKTKREAKKLGILPAKVTAVELVGERDF